MILVYGGVHPSEQPSPLLSATAGANCGSQSVSQLRSVCVFACHLLRCGGTEEERSEQVQQRSQEEVWA